jgi:methyl-accepting chemotaxis protein WspA
MKTWSVSLRLYVLMGVLLGVLALGLATILGAVKRDYAAAVFHDRLGDAAAQVRYDLLQISDALRGILMDPGDDTERRRKSTADESLAKSIASAAAFVADRPELRHALAAVAEFDAQKLNAMKERILETVGKDRAAAINFYYESYLPARREQDKLLERFVQLVESEAAGLHEAAERDRQWAAYGLATLFVLGGAAGFFFARGLGRQIEQPLGELTRSAQVVAGGDLAARIPPPKGSAEIVLLNRALAEMAGNLAALVTNVQRSSIVVTSAITEVGATAVEQQETANEVAATTTEVGATAKEISATSKDLAKTVAQVSEGAKEAAVLADHGREAIGRMDDTMRRVIEAAGGINARLTVLNDKAANIGSVVTTIAKVADQTNLLSLNAAIEAEKAGEYGRGFAVVATEIRRLADQTASATVDIEQLVKEIQSAVTAGVMGMDKFSEEVRRGATEVEKVGGQLAQIIEHVQAITPRIGAVSEGMQAQSTGAEQISQALTQLGEAARHTVDSLQRSNNVVRRLDQAARDLRSGLERFKVQE